MEIFSIYEKIDAVERELETSEPSLDLSKNLFARLAELPPVPELNDRIISLYGRCHTMECDSQIANANSIATLRQTVSVPKEIQNCIPKKESIALALYHMARLLSRSMFSEFEKALLSLDIETKAELAFHSANCGAALHSPECNTMDLIRAIIGAAEGGEYPSHESAQLVLDDLETIA